MLVIVGLGNPGEKYKYNRHNVGFMFADQLVKHLIQREALVLQELNHEDRFGSEMGKYELEGEKYIVAKPQTFMNASGDAVQRIMSYYQVPLNNLYLAHDDLDIPFGKFKLQQGVGPKLHNGVDSVEGRMGATEFHRIRIGVDARAGTPISGEAYVLQNFTSGELAQLPQIFSTIIAQLDLSDKVA